jgi:hypothetical protein
VAAVPEEAGEAGAPLAPPLIATQQESAFKRSAEVDARHVTVDTRDGMSGFEAVKRLRE